MELGAFRGWAQGSGCVQARGRQPVTGGASSAMRRTSSSSSVPAPQQRRTSPSAQALLDELLIAHTQVEVQSHHALSLEEIKERKRKLAMLQRKMEHLKYRVSLEQRIRNATATLRDVTQWEATHSPSHTPRAAGQASSTDAQPSTPPRSTRPASIPRTPVGAGLGAVSGEENQEVLKATLRADATAAEYLDMVQTSHALQLQVLGHHLAVLRDRLQRIDRSESVHASGQLLSMRQDLEEQQRRNRELRSELRDTQARPLRSPDAPSAPSSQLGGVLCGPRRKGSGGDARQEPDEQTSPLLDAGQAATPSGTSHLSPELTASRAADQRHAELERELAETRRERDALAERAQDRDELARQLEAAQAARGAPPALPDRAADTLELQQALRQEQTLGRQAQSSLQELRADRDALEEALQHERDEKQALQARLHALPDRARTREAAAPPAATPEVHDDLSENVVLSEEVSPEREAPVMEAPQEISLERAAQAEPPAEDQSMSPLARATDLLSPPDPTKKRTLYQRLEGIVRQHRLPSGSSGSSRGGDESFDTSEQQAELTALRERVQELEAALEREKSMRRELADELQDTTERYTIAATELNEAREHRRDVHVPLQSEADALRTRQGELEAMLDDAQQKLALQEVQAAAEPAGAAERDAAPQGAADGDAAPPTAALRELRELREQLEGEQREKEQVISRLQDMIARFRSVSAEVMELREQAAAPRGAEEQPSREALLARVAELEAEAPRRSELLAQITSLQEANARLERSAEEKFASRTRYLDAQVDVHRRAAEQSRRAHEELKAQYELEAEDRTQNREATQTWSTACMRICARLEQQHNFCMRVLGKADGREEMDGLLDQIKANPAMRGSPKKPIAERSREAVDSLDRVVSQLEEHISDMAEELARCGASSLGSNVIAQLEDRIEQLQAQLDEERAAGTATGEHSVLERARAAEEELAVCAHTLALLAALLPPRGTLDHSMSVPLAELHAAFSAPAGAAVPEQGVHAANPGALDEAFQSLLSSEAARSRATGDAFVRRLQEVLDAYGLGDSAPGTALREHLFGLVGATLDAAEALGVRARALEGAVEQLRSPPTGREQGEEPWRGDE